MKFYNALFICQLFLIVSLISSCVSDELAFDVVESPVLALFDGPDTGEAMMTVTATFYELDKSGILDNSIGIDSIPLSDLSISVFINENTLLQELKTDANGQAIFSKAWEEVSSSSRLEWVGVHDGVPFRIYKNF